MEFIPYLAFDGNCREAFETYAKIFKGQLVAMIKNSETPMAAQMPNPDAIMHARLVIGGAQLMGGDAPPGMYKKPTSPCINIQVQSAEEAERIFNELSPGATIVMPIGQTFFALRFGMLTDKFGTPWMINCENRGMQG